jgi:LuxR family quorum-sensing system transcriptional regulator CciR
LRTLAALPKVDMPTIDAAWRLAAEVTKVTAEDDLVDILHEVCARLGCSWFALSHHIDFMLDPSKGIRLHNYPDDWEHWFDERGLGLSDPVHRVSQQRVAGFLWRHMAELDAPRPHDAEILAHAQHHDIYDGLTIPAHLPGEAHGSVSFAWRRGGGASPEALAFAQSVAGFAFEAAKRIAQPALEAERPRLTDRQIECIVWAARGKSNWAIGRILGLTESTVREHLRNARARYNAPSRISLVIRALFDGAIYFGDVAKG